MSSVRSSSACGRVSRLRPTTYGTQDRILPFEATAQRLPALIDDLELVAVEAGPHNIGWTRHDEVNDALLEFLGAHRLTTSSV